MVAVEVGGSDLFATELSDRVALVLGNETAGISEPVLEYCTRAVSLPLANGVESLNVAAAAAVVAYDLARRRA